VAASPSPRTLAGYKRHLVELPADSLETALGGSSFGLVAVRLSMCSPTNDLRRRSASPRSRQPPSGAARHRAFHASRRCEWACAIRRERAGVEDSPPNVRDPGVESVRVVGPVAPELSAAAGGKRRRRAQCPPRCQAGQVSYHVTAMGTENGTLAEEPNEKLQNRAHHRLALLSRMHRRRAVDGSCTPGQQGGLRSRTYPGGSGRRVATLRSSPRPAASMARRGQGRTPFPDSRISSMVPTQGPNFGRSIEPQGPQGPVLDRNRR
jgi:hypothetical protein